jgi:uncharacterized repeat protein (TIGR01451 family)
MTRQNMTARPTPYGNAEKEGKENMKTKTNSENKRIKIITNQTFGGCTMSHRLRLLAITFMVIIGCVMTRQAMAQYPAVTGADTVIVNGWWSGTPDTANAKGELTCELTAKNFPSVYTGIPESLLTLAESVTVDTGFAFSSLESLLVPNDTVSNTAYDTVYFQYAIQNQANASDSFTVVAGVRDTSNAKYFIPNGFAIVKDTATTHGGAVVGTNNGTDSARYKLLLPQEGVDTFLVRIILPGPLNAADEDSLRFDLHVFGHYGKGAWDSWPDTVAGHVGHVVLDTIGTIWHVHNDTLWDYGDYQRITNYLTVNAPVLRLKKKVNPGGRLPGDTLIYTIYYDNDGSAKTQDTVNIVDMLPFGVMFLDTVGLAMDNGARTIGSHILVDYRYGNTWLENKPSSANAFDTLNAITGIRFQVPPGIGIHTANGVLDTKTSILADGDSLDTDAGYVTFKVRIR